MICNFWIEKIITFSKTKRFQRWCFLIKGNLISALNFIFSQKSICYSFKASIVCFLKSHINILSGNTRRKSVIWCQNSAKLLLMAIDLSRKNSHKVHIPWFTQNCSIQAYFGLTIYIVSVHG